uniref:AlNc14C43G3592 protein n=1 Tax=Albugo laibachii Nc14 TaxID=890382 RepID=F0WA48_9STRA|nr:AlNc14C43G3592 [Albugo laibachii Nc14]|eukprot:CCA18018.1 AlNc14C43G3592 [Albugo laibachii Nc14]
MQAKKWILADGSIASRTTTTVSFNACISQHIKEASASCGTMDPNLVYKTPYFHSVYHTTPNIEATQMTSSNRTKHSATIRSVARDAAYSPSTTTVQSFREPLSIRQSDSQSRKEKFIEWKLQKEHEEKSRREPVSSRSHLPVISTSMSQSRGSLHNSESRLPKGKRQSKLLEIRKQFMESPTMEKAKLERESAPRNESNSYGMEYSQENQHKGEAHVDSGGSRIPKTPRKMYLVDQEYDEAKLGKDDSIDQRNGNQNDDVLGQEEGYRDNNQVEMGSVEVENTESSHLHGISLDESFAVERTQSIAMKNYFDQSAITIVQSEVNTIYGTTESTENNEIFVNDLMEEENALKLQNWEESTLHPSERLEREEEDVSCTIIEDTASAEAVHEDDDIQQLFQRLDFENEVEIADETSEQGSFWQNELEYSDLLQEPFDESHITLRETRIVKSVVKTPHSDLSEKSADTATTISSPENGQKTSSKWWFRWALSAALGYLLIDSYPWIILPADLLLLGWLEVLGQVARHLNSDDHVVYKLGDALGQTIFQLPSEIGTLRRITLEKSSSMYHTVTGFSAAWSRVVGDYAVVAVLLLRAACIDSIIGMINWMSWFGSLMTPESSHEDDEAVMKQTQKLEDMQKEHDAVISEALSRLNEGEEEALIKIADMRARREAFENLTDSILAEARNAALESIRQATEEATTQIKNYALAVSKIYAKELEAELATHKALVEEGAALIQSEAEYEAELLEKEGQEMVKEVKKLQEEVQHIAEEMNDAKNGEEYDANLMEKSFKSDEDEGKDLKIEVVVQGEEVVRVLDEESHVLAESVSKVKATLENEKRVEKDIMPKDIAQVVQNVQMTEPRHDKVMLSSPISDRWMRRLVERSKEAVVMTLAFSAIAVIAFSVRRFFIRRRQKNSRRQSLHPKRWQLQAEETELLDTNEDDVAEFIPATTTDTEPEPESGDCNWESSSTISSHDDFRNMSDDGELDTSTVRLSQRVRQTRR